jgi:hypothetical protein
MILGQHTLTKLESLLFQCKSIVMPLACAVNDPETAHGSDYDEASNIE